MHLALILAGCSYFSVVSSLLQIWMPWNPRTPYVITVGTVANTIAKSKFPSLRLSSLLFPVEINFVKNLSGLSVFNFGIYFNYSF